MGNNNSTRVYLINYSSSVCVQVNLPGILECLFIIPLNLCIRYVFLAAEKKLSVTSTEPQLGGDMLAVALRNFDLLTETVDQGIAQTIFGMTVKGIFLSSLSFHLSSFFSFWTNYYQDPLLVCIGQTSQLNIYSRSRRVHQKAMWWCTSIYFFLFRLSLIYLRYSGTDVHGIDVSTCGVHRTALLEVLCSILSFCKTEVNGYH